MVFWGVVCSYFLGALSLLWWQAAGGASQLCLPRRLRAAAIRDDAGPGLVFLPSLLSSWGLEWPCRQPPSRCLLHSAPGSGSLDLILAHNSWHCSVCFINAYLPLPASQSASVIPATRDRSWPRGDCPPPPAILATTF